MENYNVIVKIILILLYINIASTVYLCNMVVTDIIITKMFNKKIFIKSILFPIWMISSIIKGTIRLIRVINASIYLHRRKKR